MTGRCQFSSLDWEPTVHAHPVTTGPISLTPRSGKTVDSVRGKMGSLYQKAKSLFTTTNLDPAILECRQHGYILLGKNLGSGSYAKVILAEVTAGVLMNNKALETDLQREGHDKVRREFIIFRQVIGERIVSSTSLSKTTTDSNGFQIRREIRKVYVKR
ncbi:Protein tyrosine kinase [Branchiostoma belcheri]|nr:Protein tyrosine kinase [Branchiostoma belcheri]